MDYPNKTDIIAAALFGLMRASDTKKGAEKPADGTQPQAAPAPLWNEAPEADRKLCLDTAGFLLAYTHGSDIRTFEPRRIVEAVATHGKGTKFGYSTSPEVVAAVFLNVSNLLG